ncbi:MAG: KH domain-containing protein [Oscillospiraceae bacterium]|nr:KH domain-containing protein [Clostridia bacterium]MBR4077103.1 KH domain-containing protein [Oscillospiraceae bacterium]
MKELLTTIVTPLVSKPQDIVISETVEGDTVTLTLHVAEEDMGRVIGKQGRIAKAIRTLMKSVAVRNDTKVVVEIV